MATNTGAELFPQWRVTVCDGVQERLKYLNGTSGLSWREIAQMGDFFPVPAGTLSTIADTGHIPKIWKRRLTRCYLPLIMLTKEELLYALNNRQPIKSSNPPEVCEPAEQ